MAERKDFLTAAEVMELLRLGRTTVYQQARLFLATGGAEGIPCRRYGRSLRFPAAELEAMVGEPPPVPPQAAKAVEASADTAEATPTPTRSRPRSPSRSRSARRPDRSQPSLLSEG